VDTELKGLLAATTEVGDAIAEGRWEEAATLEAQRRDALAIFIQAKLKRGADPTVLATDIEQLHQQTHLLLGEADHHQRKLVREAFVARTGRKAVASYARNSAKP
jgi:hypothetical protein